MAYGFISATYEEVLRIFIVLKNLSLSAWFELANLVSNGSLEPYQDERDIS
jgi:hypothetical protein